MSKTNSLRCPLCGKGRIADIPSGAEQSQYSLQERLSPNIGCLPW